MELTGPGRSGKNRNEQTMTKTDTPEDMEGAPRPEDDEKLQPGLVPRVRWDDSQMASNFANVVNVLATREDMTLLFGTNQTWNVTASDEVVVQLTNRIVLSPFAAKRLSLLLERRVKEYEDRFGKLDL
jgi:hypothetical protein